jgi:hypothetical protein
LDGISSALVATEVSQFDLDFGVDLDSDPEVSFADVQSVRLISARDTGDRRLLLELAARGGLDLDLYIPKSKIASVDDNPDIDVVNPGWNRHVMYATASLQADMTLSVTTNLDATRVRAEITDASAS